jgi:flavin reductase (DIM6/NTAB) family NADH-FMN oxidoreductase RutF
MSQSVEAVTGPAPAGIDAAAFKAVLARFASGVAVITTTSDAVPVGFTVSSFTSVSLAPPLVGFCIAETASNWPAIRRADGFVVHILGAHQHELSVLFARSGADRFGPSTRWTASAAGMPVLEDVLAHLECEIVSRVPAGDHHIVLGRPMAGGHHAMDPSPLLYFRGSYRQLHPMEG